MANVLKFTQKTYIKVICVATIGLASFGNFEQFIPVTLTMPTSMTTEFPRSRKYFRSYGKIKWNPIVTVSHVFCSTRKIPPPTHALTLTHNLMTIEKSESFKLHERNCHLHLHFTSNLLSARWLRMWKPFLCAVRRKKFQSHWMKCAPHH